MANFINPYNFVPLAKDAPSRKSREEVTQELKGQELYTGKIQYSMETLSPLFIPNTSNDRILGVKGVDDKKDAYHKSYDFFSYHDLSNDTDPNACYEPVLPGSEIRGMVRSVYEVLTNSCLSAVYEDVPLSKRTTENFKRGTLYKKDSGDYELQSKDGEHAYDISKDEAKNQRLIDRMDTLLEISDPNRDKKGLYRFRKEWEAFKKDDKKKIDDIYYSIAGEEGNRVYYLSPTRITREVYRNTLGEILDQQNKHKACSDADKACPACRLFGAVNNNLQIASGLRFSDAYVAEKKEKYADYYDKPLTLPELSTPKLSSMEFYLQRPDDKNVLSWTYDYYVTSGADGSNTVKPYTAGISGRKFYWHSSKTADWVRLKQDKIEKNERNRTVRPVKKGVAFQGELYFDKITGEELDDLIRILNLSSLEKEGKYALKLGGGRPVGLGSVAVRIEQVVYRTISLNGEIGLTYKPDNSYDYRTVGISQKMRDTGILTILDTGALGESKVHYPYVHNAKNPESGEEEGFKWFAKNRIGKGRSQTIYREYMQPPKHELVQNETGSNRERAAATYEIDKKYHGIVKGHMNDFLAKVQLETGNGIRVPVYSVKKRDSEDIKQVLPIGTKVSVTYKGKNSNGYDKWFCYKVE